MTGDTDTGTSIPPGILVVGIAGTAFGREQRAARMFSSMRRIRPYMLLSKWGDGSGGRLMSEHGLPYAELPFGYLGRARPRWTMVTLAHLPSLAARMVWAYLHRRCRGVVVLNAPSVLNALLPLLLLRYVLRAKIVFYLGDVPGRGRLARMVARVMNRIGDRVVLNSEAGRRAWAHVGVDERAMRVVYNGVDLERFASRAGGGDDEARDDAPEPIRVGFAGQLTEKKGFGDFLSMAELVVGGMPEAEFVVAGPMDSLGEEHRMLTEDARAGSVEGHLRLVDRVDAMEDFLSELDVLVVPSRFEDSSPNVCIEAMAMGLPVVATRMGGVPELVADGETGLLVPPKDLGALAEAVLRLGRDPVLRSRMGAAGRARAEARFQAGVNARAVEEVILTA